MYQSASGFGYQKITLVNLNRKGIYVIEKLTQSTRRVDSQAYRMSNYQLEAGGQNHRQHHNTRTT